MPRLAMPFLDSIGGSDEHGPERQALVRPWQSYWPPEEGSELHHLLQEKVPEVLTWRFDPKKPFDRPWQAWAKQAVLSGRMQRRVQELDAEIETLSLPFTVPNQLNYLAEDPVYETNKPYHTRLPFMSEIRRSNLYAQGYAGVKIYDLGGHQDNFTLDKSGFQYVKAPVGITKWTNESAVDQYLPAMETWLKQFFHSPRVEIITYTNIPLTVSDATLNSGLRRLNLHLPNEAEEIKKGRWRLIGPLHRWFYKQCMTPDDALILKLYDSVEGGVRFCPHAAFIDSLVPDDTPQRASIEIRAIIID
ncbi:hypothetical protein N0V84_012562 [Fusarium piperis]|uniref:Uncharacterized protein n=1 Tax=Fusarium piperis TaxID=1435070 RepID=A0A9W8W270_9HYPO|nr:hypothetical protein N0V84_012562 [Fusarium piperis]